MSQFTTLTSIVVVLPGDDVDTDQIIPARFLKGTSRDGLGAHCFADWRYDENGTPRAEFPLNAPNASDARVLVAGRNFGCGSSREHAAWALRGFGFRAVIAPSFADIFTANALENGLLPVTVSDEDHATIVRAAADGTARVSIDLERSVLTLPNGEERTFAVDPFARRRLLDGVDQLGYLLAASDEIDAFEARHVVPAFDVRGIACER